MKIKYFYTLLVINVTITITDIKAQEIEEINNSKLKNVSSYLIEARIDNADDALTKVKEIITICPSLDAHVKSFESYKTETEKKIRNISEQRKDIDMSVPQLKISGVVESKEKGYVIINANGSYYAVKSDMNIGSTFSGVIMRSEGALTYTPLGGSSYTVQKYTQGTGSTPQEKYSTMTKELENYNKEYNEQWNTFRTSCLTIINSEIKNNNTTLIERHYKSGEEYLKNKDYESAYNEFNYVQNIDPNYPNIKEKVDISNNKNSRVKRASVYNIKSIGKDHYIISTTSGIYESSDGGQTWKINSYDGIRIDKFDTCEDVMLADIPNMGIMFGKINTNGNVEWSKNVIKYSVAYAKTKTPEGKDHYNREYQIIYPDFPIRLLKIIPYENRYISFVAFDIKAGIKEKGKKQFIVQENTIWNQYYIEDAGERLRIAETCLTPDFGKNWVTYWGTLLGGNEYFSPLRDRNEVLGMIERAEEYFEVPEDAAVRVTEYISEKEGINESNIKILETSYINSKDINDEDVILVLTNIGLYKTCYDCEIVEKFEIPKEYRRPLSFYYNISEPNIIIVGFEEQGLIISRDNGKNWEGIYGADERTIDRITNVKPEIKYLENGKKSIYDIEYLLTNGMHQKGKMVQYIIGDEVINGKTYKEIETIFEGIEGYEGNTFYVRKDENGIYGLYDYDLENETIEYKLPLKINTDWITKNKNQYIKQFVTDISDFRQEEKEYGQCFKIEYDGNYNGESVQGYAIYNYEVGIVYMRMDFKGGYQELRLKEFISK